jgi:hypothetical protein
MEIAIFILTIIGTSIAVNSYFSNQCRIAREKQGVILELHGRNVVEMERLIYDLRKYTEQQGVHDEHFMQGFTYAQSLSMLQNWKVKLMEIKQNIVDHGEKMDVDEMEKNIQRLSDNLIQLDYIRNRLSGYKDEI